MGGKRRLLGLRLLVLVLAPGITMGYGLWLLVLVLAPGITMGYGLWLLVLVLAPRITMGSESRLLSPSLVILLGSVTPGITGTCGVRDTTQTGRKAQHSDLHLHTPHDFMIAKTRAPGTR
jgi:hypothetical protein